MNHYLSSFCKTIIQLKNNPKSRFGATSYFECLKVVGLTFKSNHARKKWGEIGQELWDNANFAQNLQAKCLKKCGPTIFLNSVDFLRVRVMMVTWFVSVLDIAWPLSGQLKNIDTGCYYVTYIVVSETNHVFCSRVMSDPMEIDTPPPAVDFTLK